MYIIVGASSNPTALVYSVKKGVEISTKLNTAYYYRKGSEQNMLLLVGEVATKGK